jgi:mycolipenoyl-CoA---2-(long-chain-fatty acyl)-trehalose mycolipenoyltransferase / long-chain-acyl-CoA---trehalose acyltransferase
MTGTEDFRSVTPLHTRSKPKWRHSMGWYITCAPVEFTTTGAASFTDVIANAHASIRGTLGNSKYPASKMIQMLGDDFTPTRRDMFSMVSYIDYRRMAGAERHAQSKPVTLGQTLQADDSHVWASRVHDGLHVAIRYPVTPIAPELVQRYTDRIREVLGRVAVAGDYPILTGAAVETPAA